MALMGTDKRTIDEPHRWAVGIGDLRHCVDISGVITGEQIRERRADRHRISLNGTPFKLKSMDYKSKSMDYKSKSMDYELKSMDYKSKSMDYRFKSMDYKSKS
jgi:hypothetical protein